ncbi:MAG: DUF2285 domain-containing protein [Sphingomonas sp.]|uniref:DUF2285 domain-containing protein n=1 Tax=Sphingomonas sp. TaxID=28214 RepID=UPI002634A42B|nr:DUF2285 domain-containing protein [Sphingomonas sp.]MDK2770242.1 DUF2285 domain-containing protein [Sphingomonas sp.]
MNPREHPALWSPDSAPDVVIVETADPDRAIPLPPSAEPLVEVSNRSERNLVFAHGTARLRLCVRLVPARLVPALSIPCDPGCALRLAAAARWQRVTRSGRISLSSADQPTPNQRIRFIQFLAIHDALEAGASPRDLAFGLVLPNHRPLTGALWKGSNERRQVLRLIADARRLVSNGYRRLLLHG